jgi:hypothetical protein
MYSLHDFQINLRVLKVLEVAKNVEESIPRVVDVALIHLHQITRSHAVDEANKVRAQNLLIDQRARPAEKAYLWKMTVGRFSGYT